MNQNGLDGRVGAMLIAKFMILPICCTVIPVIAVVIKEGGINKVPGEVKA